MRYARYLATAKRSTRSGSGVPGVARARTRRYRSVLASNTPRQVTTAGWASMPRVANSRSAASRTRSRVSRPAPLPIDRLPGEQRDAVSDVIEHGAHRQAGAQGVDDATERTDQLAVVLLVEAHQDHRVRRR